jgi:hypothetical protein
VHLIFSVAFFEKKPSRNMIKNFFSLFAASFSIFCSLEYHLIFVPFHTPKNCASLTLLSKLFY